MVSFLAPGHFFHHINIYKEDLLFCSFENLTYLTSLKSFKFFSHQFYYPKVKRGEGKGKM
jgi:hypothetical protein